MGVYHKGMKHIKYFSILLCLFSSYAFSHPVIYKDGFVYWGSFTPDMNTQKLSYTFDPSYSIEINSSWFSNINEYRDYTIGANYLFKRWLNADSQGNLYGSIHAGTYEDKDGTGNVGHAMLMGDWESRELYTAGNIMGIYFDNKELYKYSYRIGVAPYVAGMNTLQNWLILKFDYFKEDYNGLTITPMMRFFYKNVLWELGSNTRGDSFLTLMVHY